MYNKNNYDLDICNYSSIILNFTPSPFDSRDWFIASNRQDLPQELDLREELLPIRNQGHQGTCYAQSIACAKEWQEKKNIGFKDYFSPQFIYNQRFNKYDENQENDYGMFGRDVMKLILTVGICPEKAYPYGIIEHKDNIPPEIFKQALNYKIKSYARINSIESLKISLSKNGPCLIGFPIFNLGMEMWKKKKESDASLGGHAMTVVGYTLDSFIIRNSWGKYWGDNGYCYYKFSDWGSHWEIWTIVDDLSTIDNNSIVKKNINNKQDDNSKSKIQEITKNLKTITENKTNKSQNDNDTDDKIYKPKKEINKEKKKNSKNNLETINEDDSHNSDTNLKPEVKNDTFCDFIQLIISCFKYILKKIF